MRRIVNCQSPQEAIPFDVQLSEFFPPFYEVVECIHRKHFHFYNFMEILPYFTKWRQVTQRYQLKFSKFLWFTKRDIIHFISVTV